MKKIKEVDLTKIDELTFCRRFSGCIVLTQDRKILLQRVIDARPFFPAGTISTFGGRIELDEMPMQALIRELKEELGADVKENEVTFLGAITESVTKHTELIYTYFWHDKKGTITGCYEDEAKYYDSIDAVLLDFNAADDVRWMLTECQKRKLTDEKA